jgi:hypothetical protein
MLFRTFVIKNVINKRKLFACIQILLEKLMEKVARVAEKISEYDIVAFHLLAKDVFNDFISTYFNNSRRLIPERRLILIGNYENAKE